MTSGSPTHGGRSRLGAVQPAAAPSTVSPAPGGGPAPTPGTRDRPVVLVTGASSGIGRSSALRLASAGWHPLLSGTDPQRLTEVAHRSGGQALLGDLCRPDGPAELAAAALAAAGRVDALVACAGLGWRGPFSLMPTDALERLVTLNLTAPLRLARLLLPGMLQRGSGRIVLVGSIAGAVGVGDEAVYAATKAALSMFAESLRYELRGTGVHVCMVLPGVVDTPFFARRGTPYGRSRPRLLPPERVAEAILTALSGNRREIVVPRWLTLPERVHGLAPGLFERLAARFG